MTAARRGERSGSGSKAPGAERSSRPASRPTGRQGAQRRRSKAKAAPSKLSVEVDGERLQKFMARLGVASRRGSEEMIREQRVTINGRIAKLGDRVRPEDSVKVGAKLLRAPAAQEHHYLALHKPEGTMTTNHDPEGRPTVFDLVPHRYRKGLISVGRLDYGTEGLLLLTTDGAFAERVAHPRYGCAKTYLVKVKGTPEVKSIETLAKGIRLDGVRLQPSKITPHRVGGKVRVAKKNTWWKVEITEGKTRQVRRMFERFGHLVTRLRRVQIGPVTLGRLPKGDLRELTEREVNALVSVSRPS